MERSLHKLEIRFVIMAVLFFAVIGAIDFSARAQNQVLSREPFMEKRSAVVTPTPGEFPIVAYTVFNDNFGPTKEGIEGVKECGFNLCMQASTADQIEKLLECIDGSGLKLLLHTASFRNDPSDKKEKWREELTSFVNKFKDNPNVAGWNFKDEPMWKDLDGLKKRYDLLVDTDPSHFIWINLVGQVRKEFTGPCKTLGEYMDSIQNVFDMDVWSFDYYPLWMNSNGLFVSYEYFYKALQAYADKAKETGRPMWSFCESAEYIAKTNQPPRATLPYLSFEIFSSIAYGAQGISYWTYWQRPSNESVTYLSALVDEQGKKLPAWYAAREINYQIRTLTPVFLGGQMVECKHTGSINMKGTLPVISNFGPVQELSNEKKGVLVSHLRNHGHDYLMIVNHDVEKRQRVGIRFKSASKVERIEAGSDKINRKRVKGMQNISLSPGGYALFEWR